MKKQFLVVTSLTALLASTVMFTKNSSNFKMNIAEQTNHTVTFTGSTRQVTTDGGNIVRVYEMPASENDCLFITHRTTAGLRFVTTYNFKKIKQVDITIKTSDCQSGYIEAWLSRTSEFIGDEDDIGNVTVRPGTIPDNTTYTFEFDDAVYPDTYADDYSLQIWFSLMIPSSLGLGNYAYTEVSSISITYYC